MLFIGSAIAVFGILYKVSFIDEEQLDVALNENGDDAQARRDSTSNPAADVNLKQFDAIDEDGSVREQA